jgi:glycerophosphoryl diester phosphodiesterase
VSFKTAVNYQTRADVHRATPGDFTWNFWVNGEAFGTQNEEVQISSGTGLNMSLTKVLDLDLTDTQEVLFKGEIIERDGLASGGDDRLPPLTQSYLLYKLTGTTIGFQRLNEGRDPDVAVAWKVEILSGVQPPQPPCTSTRTGTTNNDLVAVSNPRTAPALSLGSRYSTCGEETWIGTAPICEGHADDCTFRHMMFVRSDPAGDGKRCLAGQKVLCKCDPTNRKRPFYLIAHRTNTVDKARQALEGGANGLELDVRFQPERQRFCVNHDTTAFCDRETLDLYFAGLRLLIADNSDQLALLIFDFKNAGGDITAGRKLLEAVRAFVAGTNLNVLVSVAKWNDRDWLRGMGPLRAREALAIDEDDNPARVAEFFREIEVKNNAYGNGSCVVCPEPPEKAFDAALDLRAQGVNRFVYIWTLRNEESMRRFISKGVDGILVNDIAALGRALCSTCVAHLATRDHNPFQN